MSNGLIIGEDGKTRCAWCGHDTQYQNYHDTEWGVPIYDSRALFEKLILDGFQAGLSWITILKKRENFIAAFDGFEPEVIAEYGPDKIDALMNDKGIVRNRAKIEGTVINARLYLEIENKESGFSQFLWNYLGGHPIQNNWKSLEQVPAETEISKQISKDLKSRGFKFVGPTIVYAFMQAVGMVNDHPIGCFRHDQVKNMQDPS
ncbi:DNA-3-methyladenine glycosylase I [Sneathiella glossodoripedis]|uniref:DNA-3-methyladenine glycosylase I n=1 Tax=Sneathiella glossodoripedis TaxID=418853 RepID=UPI00046E648D|nr:DNA-3-methyladenine glycosylase I [Sneathiella glossodoripedis]